MWRVNRMWLVNRTIVDTKPELGRPRNSFQVRLEPNPENSVRFTTLRQGDPYVGQKTVKSLFSELEWYTLLQARRHGGHSGAVPPQMTACVPQARTVSRRN